MAVYFVFYLWQNRELDLISWETIKSIFVRLCQGETPESPHYWLMYTLLSVYIVIPFFRYMFKDMSYRRVTAVTIIELVLMTLNLFSPIKFKVSSFLGSWEGVAIIGYWVTRPETKKYYRMLIGLGVAAFVLMAVFIGCDLDYRTLCCNASPVMTLISTGTFATVFLGHKFFHKGNVVLKILSKYSYSLILIHWWTLHWITRGRYDIQVLQHHGLGLFLSLGVTLLVSLIAAILIDNYVLTFVQQVFDWILEGIEKGIAKVKKRALCIKMCSALLRLL